MGRGAQGSVQGVCAKGIGSVSVCAYTQDIPEAGAGAPEPSHVGTMRFQKHSGCLTSGLHWSALPACWLRSKPCTGTVDDHQPSGDSPGMMQGGVSSKVQLPLPASATPLTRCETADVKCGRGMLCSAVVTAEVLRLMVQHAACLTKCCKVRVHPSVSILHLLLQYCSCKWWVSRRWKAICIRFCMYLRPLFTTAAGMATPAKAARPRAKRSKFCRCRVELAAQVLAGLLKGTMEQGMPVAQCMKGFDSSADV